MTREEAIMELNRFSGTTQLKLSANFWTALEMAIKALEKKPKWIPCSERLPDDRKDCIVTFKDGCVDTMYYAPDLYKVDDYDFYAKKGKAGWYDYDSEWGYYSRDDVVAWMPLPEPYKADNRTEQGLAYADQDTMMPAT